MPGRFFLTSPMDEVANWLGWTGPRPNDPPRFNVAPGQQILTLGPKGLTAMRWGMIPVGRVNARGRPVMETIVNARSETVFDKSAYAGVQRAVVPVNGWYEWTGATRRKTAWRIRPVDGGLMGFASICDTWIAPDGRPLHQVATVTCAPSADVSAVHDRMGVILRADQVQIWLHGKQEQAAALMQPYPDGCLTVEPANGMDWDGA
jgi:putative SOS response-associated peptidase YedK